MPTSASELFIVDNSDSEWKVRNYLADWCELSKTIDIATRYFEIGAFLALKDKWQQVDSIRLMDEIDEVIEAHGSCPGPFQISHT